VTLQLKTGELSAARQRLVVATFPAFQQQSLSCASVQETYLDKTGVNSGIAASQPGQYAYLAQDIAKGTGERQRCHDEESANRDPLVWPISYNSLTHYVSALLRDLATPIT
jgi:hypothetical protein